MAVAIPRKLTFWHAAHADAESRRAAIERLRRLAVLMDSSIRLPGVNYRIGLDGILGFVPGAGDAIGLLISAYIVFEARRLGATRKQLALMAANVLIDALVGTVPIFGDVFDFAFKANVRNLRIMGIEPGQPPTTSGSGAEQSPVR